MITVTEAERLVFEETAMFPLEERALADAYGAALREAIYADRDQPAFNRATMDGIAVNFSAWQGGQQRFLIKGIQKAGDPQQTLSDPSTCLEIMTGAALPSGCDCVVPVEQITVRDGYAEISSSTTLVPNQGIHAKAGDYRQGDRLLDEGTVLNPQSVSLAAAVGKARVQVTRSPRIAVVGTGDELVEIDQPVRPEQIRRSNAYALEAIFYSRGFRNVQRFHVRDDKEALRKTLAGILAVFDVVVMSGGVSMGKFDFVPMILTELGVKVVFHKVRQKPGKPLWFGVTHDRKPVFALPGNPVSTQICAYRYVVPYLFKASMIKEIPVEWVTLADPMKSPGELTQFIPVTVGARHAVPLPSATPIPLTGSGDYAALARSDGFVEWPCAGADTEPSRQVRFFRW